VKCTRWRLPLQLEGGSRAQQLPTPASPSLPTLAFLVAAAGAPRCHRHL